MASGWSSWKGHDVTLAKLPITVVQADRGHAAQNDDELLARVVEVVHELRTAGLKLPDRRTQRSALGARDASSAYAAPVGYVVPHVRGVRQSGIRVGDRERMPKRHSRTLAQPWGPIPQDGTPEHGAIVEGHDQGEHDLS